MEASLTMRLLTLTSESDITTLLSQPETGMGFQIIQARVSFLEGYREQRIDGNFLVLNSQFLIPFEDREGILSLVRLTDETPQERFPEAIDVSSFLFINALGSRLVSAIQLPSSIPSSAGTPPPPVVTVTGSYQAFLRFSRFPNDPRVATNGDLKPNTFATTFNDARMVPSGLAAVGRYALPFQQPAKYVYTIIPPPDTLIHMGTVRPNFGQAGGGVEVFFPNGSGPGSFLPHELPEA